MTKEQEDKVLELYARGKPVLEVAQLVGSTRYQVERYLLRTSTYIFARERRKNYHKPMEQLIKEPFSTDENDYGDNLPTYKLHELSFVERSLLTDKNHKELRQWTR